MVRVGWTKLILVAAAIGLSFVGMGCAAMYVHRHELDQFGHVFYLDGAGGGSEASPWASGVRKGLDQRAYKGDFYVFPWNTGLGVAVDQAATVEYKRQKAGELAGLIRTYMDEHPGRPVDLIGLSAGTALTVFTLEALPERYKVNSVVLLGSSLNAHYDLTEALKRTRNKMYVYTSEKDAVLGVLVSLAGTADRVFCGACAAGLRGFHFPGSRQSDRGSRELYTKVENINWRPEFSDSGNYGGHTDGVNPRFVRDFVAPLLVVEGPRFTDAGMQPVVQGEAQVIPGT